MLRLCLQGERGHLWEVGAACPVLPYDLAHRPGGCQRATPARPGPSLVVRRESSEPSELLCQVRIRSGKNSQPCFCRGERGPNPGQARAGPRHTNVMETPLMLGIALQAQHWGDGAPCYLALARRPRTPQPAPHWPAGAVCSLALLAHCNA